MSARLSEAARREVENHVDDCDSCRQLLVALVREAPPDAPRWEPGDQVGRYVVGTPVGRGAMGEVFRAYDGELARPVALKRLHAQQDVGARARLVREARSAAQLQHPNVVAVYEIVDDAAGAVLAIEWIDGVTLRAWLAAAERSWRDVLAVVAGAGRGLAAAHAAGIVHRDFKPENVLVDRRGRARVADFGLASAFDVAESTTVDPTTPLRVTITGTVAGTPAYMAPELIDGARPDARSDQFAFAVTLFEAVTRTYPFAGKTAEAIWAQMTAGQIAKHDARIPAWLDRALRKAMSPDPAHRFASMDEFLDLAERRSRRGIGMPVVAAGALGGIVVAGLALALAPSSKEPAAKCGDELVDGVWSPAARVSIAKQFTAAAPVRAAASLAFADQQLDQWTGAWRLSRRAACTAAEPAQRRARTACLDRQLGELRAQVAVWQRADADVVDHAALALASLPSPSDCTTATAVAASPAPPAFSDATAEIEALRRAGKYADARPKIAALLPTASTQPDALARAHAFLAFATIEYELRDHVTSHAHLATAAQAARQAGDEQLLAEILVLDAGVRIVAHHSEEALGVLDTVEALSPRDNTRARVEAVRGEALGTLDRYDESIAAYRRGTKLLEQEVARDPSLRLRLAAMIGATGSMLSASGRHAEGIVELQRALKLEETIYGADHPEIARTLHDLAYAQRFNGDNTNALANFLHARTIFASAMGEQSLEVATTEEALADIALDAGDSDRAYELATRARDIYTKIDAEPSLISSIETTLGNIQEDNDHCNLALPHYERSLAAAKRANQTGIPLAISYTNVATCLAEIGHRDAEARNAVEAALDAFDADPKRDPGRTHAMAVLALLEARGGRYSHAIELADQILAMLEDLEGASWDAIRDEMTSGKARWRRNRP